MTTPAPAQRKASAVLDCPPAHVGRCARCHQPCHRYGFGGNPLRSTCRETVEAARPKRKPS
ncbi:hypothetical protein OH809_44240 (plasmid) [Streptomyces sp. NBC_00873]|uniref:hypothetical protein n=1 Tax=unclassified Streptomyces TaxID=2593676 RepID=UPI002F913CAA|nr:hypothetical protein OH809_44710 [Streptomyces sp. NBC_00873]WSY97659.1 hypothetical protein OH809_44240 [Streptomyces sp. NBC_00873]WTA49239.1 hypothetical protein OH821_43925 [Streptomyces sp. NBC_00842]